MCTLLIGILFSWAALVIGDCTYGASQLIQGTRTNKRGQFVDLDHPIPCSGVISSIRFCYYTDTMSDNSETHTIYFRILRYDPEEDILRQTHSFDRGFDLQQTRRSFMCDDHYYEDETVNVLAGDYVAVYLPMYMEPLSILGRDLPGMTVYEDSRLLSTQFYSPTVRQSDLELEVGMAIHVSAEINRVFFNAFPATPTNNASVPNVSLGTPSTISAGDSSSPSTFTLSTLFPTPVVEVTLKHDGSTRDSVKHYRTTSASVFPESSVKHYKTTSASVFPESSVKHYKTTSASVFPESAGVPSSSSLPPGNTQNTSGAGFPMWVIATLSSGALLLVLSAFLSLLAIFVRLRQRKERSMLKKKVTTREISSIYETPQNMRRDGNSGEGQPNDVVDVSIYESVPTMENTQQLATAEFDAAYSMLGPEADYSEQQAAAAYAPSLYMHYEMEIFDNMYSTPVSIEKGEILSTRIRKVISTLKDQTPVPFHQPASEEEAIYRQLSYHKPAIRIPAGEIQVRGHLGSGHFASVEKGVWISSTGTNDVAVKTLHRDAGYANKVKCLQEAAIMAQFHHPNIVHLHGIVVNEDNTISLVMEFLNGGDLSERLKTRHRQNGVDVNTPLILLNYSIQVTLGMVYLSEKGFVHRDLAARNVLISNEDICKIGDFGMSRELEDSIYYRSAGGIIPVKWTAPEAAFYRKYSTASDVWSFGCVLYEIWSLGEKPFSSLFNNEVLEKVTAGCRLPPPPGCPRDIYKLMIDCWNPVPASRPMFKDIITFLIGDEEELLTIPFEDASTDNEAFRLGAPLRAGHKMYLSLQTKYMDN